MKSLYENFKKEIIVFLHESLLKTIISKNGSGLRCRVGNSPDPEIVWKKEIIKICLNNNSDILFYFITLTQGKILESVN